MDETRDDLKASALCSRVPLFACAVGFMSQGGLWSRLMSEETEIDDIGSLPIGTEPSQPIVPKRRAIRAANYFEEEDIQLCESWENVSLDPIAGNEQRSKAFWKRIHDNFHENKKFASDRNANSLEHRWATIHKECQKFQCFCEDVERRHPREGNSPSSVVDVFDVEDEGRKSQTPDSSTPSSERPMGRKQAKKLKKGGEQANYHSIEKMFIEREKIREDRWQEHKKIGEDRWQEHKMLQERKLSLEQRKIENDEKKMFLEQEQKLMFCDLNTLDPDQKTYVIATRAQIAAEKMAAFNRAFGGSSGGHEASGGGEI